MSGRENMWGICEDFIKRFNGELYFKLIRYLFLGGIRL